MAFNLAPGSTQAWLRESSGPPTCDECAAACETGHGFRDRSFNCCICHRESARRFGPRGYVVDLCDLCKEREE